MENTKAKKKRTDLTPGPNAKRNATIQAWNEKNTTQKKLRLHNRIDRDLLDHFDSLGNFQGYIKKLVRDDIGRGQDGAFNEFLKIDE